MKSTITQSDEALKTLKSLLLSGADESAKHLLRQHTESVVKQTTNACFNAISRELDNVSEALTSEK